LLTHSQNRYALTPHSLYAAVSVGLETATVLTVLNRLSKARLLACVSAGVDCDASQALIHPLPRAQTHLPREIELFVRECTQNYGKVKLVLQRNRFFLESAHPEVLRTLLKARDASRTRLCWSLVPIHIPC
jgi:DNA excision repair protein ERCC-3